VDTALSVVAFVLLVAFLWYANSKPNKFTRWIDRYDMPTKTLRDLLFIVLGGLITYGAVAMIQSNCTIGIIIAIAIILVFWMVIVIDRNEEKRRKKDMKDIVRETIIELGLMPKEDNTESNTTTNNNSQEHKHDST
jgi:hypothetical protein